MSGDQWDGLRSFLQRNAVDDLPAAFASVFDGTRYMYVHLTPSGGRRVFMNNPHIAYPGSVYHQLVWRFNRLRDQVEGGRGR